MLPYVCTAAVIIGVYWIADKTFGAIVAATILNAILVPIVWNISSFLIHNEMTAMFLSGYLNIMIVIMGIIGLAFVGLVATCLFLKALLGQKDYTGVN